MTLRAGPDSPKILVVDDEPSILEMMRLRLESLGAVVNTVARGGDALQAARSDPPDVILLDVMMPDVDGFTVIQQLKQDEQVRDIPVIFMTARDEIDSRVQGLDRGAQDYVTKPFNTTELIARIRAALRVKQLQDELREKNHMLERLAGSDPLTGLPNRRVFDEQVYLEMERARRTGHSLSCLIFDIDDFKEINDRHGHQVGDEVLRHMSRVLKGRKRAVDLIARYGGEEFVWLLAGAARKQAVDLGHWLLRTISGEKVQTSDGPIHASVSVGVTTYVPQDHGEITTTLLLHHADNALLDAKAQGKGCVVFHELSPFFEEGAQPEEEPLRERFDA